MSRQFTCACCGGVYTTSRPEQDVNREYLQNFPDGGVTGPSDKLVSVCDDCYAYVLDRLRELR